MNPQRARHVLVQLQPDVFIMWVERLGSASTCSNSPAKRRVVFRGRCYSCIPHTARTGHCQAESSTLKYVIAYCCAIHARSDGIYGCSAHSYGPPV